MWETLVLSLCREDPLEKEMATQSSILAWEIPQTVKPGGLQSIGLQRVRHDPSDLKHTLESHSSIAIHITPANVTLDPVTGLLVLLRQDFTVAQGWPQQRGMCCSAFHR